MQDWVKTVPKAVLHDHLDGGLRVETLIELANQGHCLANLNFYQIIKRTLHNKYEK